MCSGRACSGSTDNMNHKVHSVTVAENLIAFRPPLGVRRAVERLLAHVPPQYLLGLETVVLRDEGGLVRREKLRRRRWLRQGEFILGCYFRSTSKRRARIELFVDRICEKWPKSLMRFPPLRDIRIGSILFHEVGHHIHRQFRVDDGPPELVAKKWQKRLMRKYMQEQYWYLMPIFQIANFFWKKFTKTKKCVKES